MPVEAPVIRAVPFEGELLIFLLINISFVKNCSCRVAAVPAISTLGYRVSDIGQAMEISLRRSGRDSPIRRTLIRSSSENRSSFSISIHLDRAMGKVNAIDQLIESKVFVICRDTLQSKNADSSEKNAENADLSEENAELG